VATNREKKRLMD